MADRSEYMREYYKENRQALLDSKKKWRDKNKEHNKLYMREYRARKKAEKLALENAVNRDV